MNASPSWVRYAVAVTIGLALAGAAGPPEDRVGPPEVEPLPAPPGANPQLRAQGRIAPRNAPVPFAEASRPNAAAEPADRSG